MSSNPPEPMSRARPRVAIFFTDFRCGGVERMRTLMSAEFLRRGVDVDLIVLDERGELRATVPGGVRVISLEAPRIRRALVPLTRYLRSTPPDALLADMWPLTSVAVVAARLARFTGRVVVADHNMLSLTPLYEQASVRAAMRATMRVTYPRAHARIAVSAGVAEDLSSIGQLARGTIDVIHNASATVVPKVAPSTPGPWGVHETAGARLLCVGTLKEQKDHATLLRAFRLLRDQRSARLAIIGDGPLAAETRELVHQLGLDDDVLMPGFVDDVASWYVGADLFVLSSRYEGFGNVIVEALQHGVPVVSTDCRSGPREILDDGRYGRLVPPGDAEQLAAGMVQALDAPRAPEQLKRRAADFGFDAISERYLDALLPPTWRAHDPAAKARPSEAGPAEG